MSREIEKFYPNLEGHSVIVIEDFSVSQTIITHLKRMEKMKTFDGSMRQVGTNGLLSLSQQMEYREAEAMIIHPWDNDKCIDQIIEANQRGYKVIVMLGNEDVDPERIPAYQRLKDSNIKTIERKNIIKGEVKFINNISSILSALFS
jgi:hypothetical protein